MPHAAGRRQLDLDPIADEDQPGPVAVLDGGRGQQRRRLGGPIGLGLRAPGQTACSPRRRPPARGTAPAPRRTAARTAGLAAPSRSSRGAARHHPARRPAARRTSARSPAVHHDTPRRAARPRPAAPGTAAAARGGRSRRHPGVRVTCGTRSTPKRPDHGPKPKGPLDLETSRVAVSAGVGQTAFYYSTRTCNQGVGPVPRRGGLRLAACRRTRPIDRRTGSWYSIRRLHYNQETGIADGAEFRVCMGRMPKDRGRRTECGQR